MLALLGGEKNPATKKKGGKFILLLKSKHLKKRKALHPNKGKGISAKGEKRTWYSSPKSPRRG